MSRLVLIFFGLKIGINSFIRGDYRIALKRIILPVNYWRVSIFKHVVDCILKSDHCGEEQIRILDIGSPKLLSLFLANRVDGTIYSTDLQDRTIFTEWKKHYQNMSNKNNLIFEFQNAKKLTYPDKWFDIVYSLSVIHMIAPAENGDILALREIQKKIRPGGLLILEVPYRLQYAVNYANRDNFEEKYSDQPLFKERQYDDAALETRIGRNVGGSLLNEIRLKERIPFDDIWTKLPKALRMLFALIEPWMDIINVSVSGEERSHRVKSAILVYQIKG